MPAAVVNFAADRGSVELREVGVPEIGSHDVLLEVANVGVCGSDLHQWTGDHSWPVNYPVVLGHEFGGTIVAVGDSVTGWHEGDRVVSETAAIIDPDSPLTRRGLYNLDPGRKGFGYGVNGAMTRFVCVPARILHRLPAGLSFEQACLTEPCCVAYSAVVKNARIEPGDRVVVLGPGTIGILCAAIARLCGAEVAVVGLPADQGRLEVAKQYGCDIIVGTPGPGPSTATAWAATGWSMPPGPVPPSRSPSTSCDRPAGLPRWAGAHSRWASPSIHWYRKMSRCRAVSATTGRSGSG